jgi:hypothetical protein
MNRALPGRLHNLWERCPALALEQAQNLGLLAAVARYGGLCRHPWRASLWQPWPSRSSPSWAASRVP